MEVKCLSVYLCRLVGDSFCLCVDHGRLFGSGISGVKTLMNKPKRAQIRVRTAAQTTFGSCKVLYSEVTVSILKILPVIELTGMNDAFL